MSAIRITDLPVLDELQDRDLVNFQRLVDGVWTDFHTDGETLQGEIRTFIQVVDLSIGGEFTVYSPDTDELVVPISAWGIFDDSGSGIGFGFLVNDIGLFSSGTLDASSILHISAKYAVPAGEAGQFTFMDTDLVLRVNVTGGSGSGVIFVQYAVVPKV